MRFYEVEAKCGHVGLTNCVWIKFAVKAKTSKEAADAVKRYGRVKRNHKDFIRGVSEISYDEYRILARENKYDPYLNARNIREQRAIPDFDERVEVDPTGFKETIRIETIQVWLGEANEEGTEIAKDLGYWKFKSKLGE